MHNYLHVYALTERFTTPAWEIRRSPVKTKPHNTEARWLRRRHRLSSDLLWLLGKYGKRSYARKAYRLSSRKLRSFCKNVQNSCMRFALLCIV
jgi:hypothetical protein